MQVSYRYLGEVSYPGSLTLMDEAIATAYSTKSAILLGLTHPLVYTRGLTTRDSHIRATDLEVIPARRGGSVTVHGPGQLVVYTMIPLAGLTAGLEGLIRYFEGTLLEILWDMGIAARQEPPHSGLFSRKGKIAFVGIGAKHGVTYHGISLNVSNDPDIFTPIFSCGLQTPISRLRDLTNYELPELPELTALFGASLSQRLADDYPEPGWQGRFRQLWTDRRSARLAREGHISLWDAFAAGILYFNERRYWHAHEAWEVFWHHQSDRKSPAAYFLQGAIQLAMALWKRDGNGQANFNGMASLSAKALSNWEKAGNLPEEYILNLPEVLGYLKNTGQGQKSMQPPMLVCRWVEEAESV